LISIIDLEIISTVTGKDSKNIGKLVSGVLDHKNNKQYAYVGDRHIRIYPMDDIFYKCKNYIYVEV